MKFRPKRRCFIFWFPLFFLLSAPLAGFAQEGTPAPFAEERPKPAESETAAEDRSTLNTLQALSRSLQNVRENLREINAELKSTDDEETRAALRRESEQLTRQLGDLQRDFERIATGVETDGMADRRREEFNWRDELTHLISPFVQELKKMTERPRQIEQLRSDILYFENRLGAAKKGLDNIRRLQSGAKQLGGEEAAPELPELRERILERLGELEARWSTTFTDIENQLAVTRYRLEDIQKEKKSLLESTQNVLRIFFKTRGRNFLLALMAFITVLLLLRFLHRLIYKYSPLHDVERRTFYVRLGDVVYHILTILGATGAGLITLYATGDWLLLSLTIVFLFGLAWTAKEGLHRFWQQVQLLLNLGTVRENERLIYDGVPWRVLALNLYVRLENPALSNGWIRLPLRELIEQHSRPYHPDEPWFPCHPGDWVRLADGGWGRVKTQSPDMVQLALRGAGIKTFPTADFLALNPENLSAGFRLRVLFGFDYAHQAIITTEIPEKLLARLREGLHLRGYADMLHQLKVEVAAAGASSLDILTLADFSGAAAEKHKILTRLIQALTIDACNEYGWIVPFAQVTVHAGTAFTVNPGAEAGEGEAAAAMGS
ncbi:MAG: hypothetical protein ACOC98_06960 [Thermodesulfobacteriota bacterium]